MAGNGGETTMADDKIAVKKSRGTERGGVKMKERGKRKKEGEGFKMAIGGLCSSPRGQKVFAI